MTTNTADPAKSKKVSYITLTLVVQEVDEKGDGEPHITTYRAKTLEFLESDVDQPEKFTEVIREAVKEIRTKGTLVNSAYMGTVSRMLLRAE